MRFEVDDDRLELSLVLEGEAVNLTDLHYDGQQLGDAALDIAVEELLRCHREKRAPDGQAWAQLAGSTVRQKGHALVGIRTGRMLDPGRVAAGPRWVEDRSATYQFPQDKQGGKEHGYHNGNERNRCPARPLVGWTSQARHQVEQLIRSADGD